MPNTSTESLNTTVTTSSVPTSPASASLASMPKDTATIFNPAKPNIAQESSQADVSQANTNQPYHHKAIHNQNRSIELSSDVTLANSATIDAPVNAAPKGGFVSLGCPKALVDSERIITELSRDG